MFATRARWVVYYIIACWNIRHTQRQRSDWSVDLVGYISFANLLWILLCSLELYLAIFNHVWENVNKQMDKRKISNMPWPWWYGSEPTLPLANVICSKIRDTLSYGRWSGERRTRQMSKSSQVIERATQSGSSLTVSTEYVYPLLFIPHIEQNKGLICTTDWCD